MNAIPAPSWHPALEARHAPLVEKLERLIPCMEVPLHLPWIDAFLNAAMILSGMGPVNALETTGGNVVRTAECLNTHPRQVYRWIERHEIKLEQYRR